MNSEVSIEDSLEVRTEGIRMGEEGVERGRGGVGKARGRRVKADVRGKKETRRKVRRRTGIDFVDLDGDDDSVQSDVDVENFIPDFGL